MPPSNDVDEFRRILSRSHDIVVLAGAGLSAGSGEVFPTRICTSVSSPDRALQAFLPFAPEMGCGMPTP